MTPAVIAKHLNLSEHECRSTLLPHLRARVFHVTRMTTLGRILEDGRIDPNSLGLLGNSFPQSANSYGRHKGYVCLFDYRSKTQEAIDHGFDCLDFLRAGFAGDEIAIIFLGDEATETLILHS